MQPADSPPDAPVLLFDGECAMCQHVVRWVLAHERAPRVQFAALQGEAARRWLPSRLPAAEWAAMQRGAPDTLVLLQDGECHLRSEAAWRLAEHLRAPWRLLRWTRLWPRAVRDAGYRFVARRRLAWFGRSDQCMIPAPEQRARFLP